MNACNDGTLFAEMQTELYYCVCRYDNVGYLMKFNVRWARSIPSKQEQRIMNKRYKNQEIMATEKRQSIKIKTERSAQALILLMELGLPQDIAWTIAAGAYWLL